ncbi:hypothetical protein IWW36_002325 [Coemansia brasiliensis]|uniref:Uncharacterized protein n=1 Tax=Coemansia brasiliensis TaxID=2650707 RepID=A0A9W8I859_9FUNG|nr:hypothetical protein IWW36_002325 [Coemansia brasiliensis]
MLNLESLKGAMHDSPKTFLHYWSSKENMERGGGDNLKVIDGDLSEEEVIQHLQNGNESEQWIISNIDTIDSDTFYFSCKDGDLNIRELTDKIKEMTIDEFAEIYDKMDEEAKPIIYDLYKASSS